MPVSSNDEYLTVAEIAELLKLNQQTVRNFIDRGELRALQVGPRRVRVRRSDLDVFLRVDPEERSAGRPADETSATPSLPATSGTGSASHSSTGSTSMIARRRPTGFDTSRMSCRRRGRRGPRRRPHAG
jgi:excisionase family DNA binding protein